MIELRLFIVFQTRESYLNWDSLKKKKVFSFSVLSVDKQKIISHKFSQ